MSDKITVLIMHTPPTSSTSTTPPVQTDGTRHLSRWRESWPDRCNPPIFPFLPPGCSPSYQVFNLSSPGGGWRQSAKNLSGTFEESSWLMRVLCLPGVIACFFGRLCWSSGPGVLVLAGVSHIIALFLYYYYFFFLLMAYPRNQTVLHMGPKSDYYFFKFLFNFENTGTDLISMEED